MSWHTRYQVQQGIAFVVNAVLSCTESGFGNVNFQVRRETPWAGYLATKANSFAADKLQLGGGGLTLSLLGSCPEGGSNLTKACAETEPRSAPTFTLILQLQQMNQWKKCHGKGMSQTSAHQISMKAAWFGTSAVQGQVCWQRSVKVWGGGGVIQPRCEGSVVGWGREELCGTTTSWAAEKMLLFSRD